MLTAERQVKNSTQKSTVVIIGKESTGKTRLISSLTGHSGHSTNVKGTTVHCDRYEGHSHIFIDTPGIIIEEDTHTTKSALEALADAEHVMLVVSALQIDEDLADLLPLVRGKTGMVVISFWDKFKGNQSAAEQLRTEGIACIEVDARNLDEKSIEAIHGELAKEHDFTDNEYISQHFWRYTPEKTLFDRPVAGKIASLLLLFLPAAAAVYSANSLADALYGPLYSLFSPLLNAVNSLPAPLNYFLGLDYGIVAMFPFLLLYALPTILLFAVFLGIYKTSGLLDKISASIHPLLAPFGLGGRDLVRVVMGFGCNVPAVINSRACSVSTRRACVHAIGFGSACSYQLPATIAVFSAAGLGYLAFPFLLLLTAATLFYLFLLRKGRRERVRLSLVSNSGLLTRPGFKDTMLEVRGVIRQFFTLALPVFVLICLVASLLAWTGLLDAMTRAVAPLMGIFRLPPEAAPAVILGSVRKDGIAIGLLNPDWGSFKAGVLTPLQTLTAVFLAGTLLPCLVTVWTIRKEFGIRRTASLVMRQMGFSVMATLAIAWIGGLLVM